MTIRMMTMAPLAVALMLAACGGGAGNDSTAPRPADSLLEIPASASQSAAGLVGYLQSVRSLDAEMRHPVALDSFAPLAVDDAEPLAVGG